MIIPTNNSIINSKEFKDKIAIELEIYDISTNQQKEQMFKDSITKLFLYNQINETFNSYQTEYLSQTKRMFNRLEKSREYVKE